MARFFCLYLTAIINLAVFARVFTGASVASNGLMLATYNRVLNNTMEQSLIFFFLGLNLAYSQSPRLAQLTLFHMIGRTLFAVGYVVGAPLDFPALRSPGFFLTLVSNVGALYYTFRP
jgi:hypothetical protein